MVPVAMETFRADTSCLQSAATTLGCGTPRLPFRSWVPALVGLLLGVPAIEGQQVPLIHGPELARETFEAAWERIRETHFDPEMVGEEWLMVRDELRPRARASESVEELREVLEDMLSRLGDSHFSIIPAVSAEVFSQDTDAIGAGDVGVTLRWIDGTLLLHAIREGSPADRAGLRSGWILEAIDDVEIDSLATRVSLGTPSGGSLARHLSLWLPVAAGSLLAGGERTEVTLRLTDGSEVTGDYVLEREASPGNLVRFGDLPVPALEVDHHLEEHDGTLIGFLRLSTWFPPALDDVARAMQDLREADGLVLDLRGNPGGLAALAMGIGGHFLDEPVSLGTLHTRDAVLQFPVNPQRIDPDGHRVDPYSGPLAIVVDPMTASTSEVFAGGLQGLGRARVFGEPTAGQALPALVSSLPNGDRLLHAIADFTAADGSRLEGQGVVPDVLAPPSRTAWLAGRDPAVEAAVAWITSAIQTTSTPSPNPEIDP
jgi:carboxyl-terminal processing protease